MRAAVLSIGAEILRGDILDTNARFLARELSALGFDVRRLATSGDVLDRLTEEVRSSLAVAEVVVCTGGLGPTRDDLTRGAVAAALGEEITVDERLVDGIAGRFGAMGRQMPPRNRQQAEVIPSATVLPNPNGTAPGWYVERDGSVIVTLPGPPREMIPMWRDSVRPRLERLLPGCRVVRSLMTFGVGESRVEQQIDDVISWRNDVIVATYARDAGVQIHVTAVAETVPSAGALAAEAEALLRAQLGHAVYGTGEATLSETLAALLQERNLSVGVIESCTGGEIASAITDVHGSSSYFLGGVVAYSREAKVAHGVDPGVMEKYGLISRETARAMAAAACAHFGAAVGIAATGIAGSEPQEGKAPGTCFIAVSLPGRTRDRELHRPGDRSTAKRYFAQCALDLTRLSLSVREDAAV